MATRMTSAARQQLELEIAAIGRDAAAPRAAAPPLSECIAPGGGVINELSDASPRPAEPFTRWLLAQQDRGDWIDDLARAARGDPRFPKAADPHQVRGYLSNRGITDADVFEQLDDAERMWLSL